ncbi:hypothetical protein [Nocardioides ochotonae]|uniref:hypothetical protein n=1 Tax=Nocardioides ochotonae TaxID=2685869 RepID=UPI00140CC813|nr:hypothetical protein [Nocardioides ochotonae]
MTMDTPLFGDEMPSTPPVASTTTHDPVSDWQVDLLRKALDARELTNQNARRALVEEHAGRSLTSLRDLTSEEALQVITALGRKAAPAQSGSSWDEREDDTWIDRL